MTTLNETPSSNRLHIGFFGKRNSGKSSLINAFTNQNVSIVSDVAGTTTDPVNKPMEIHGLGACVLVDTAGFDDEGELGRIRVEKTKKAAEKIDIAVILFKDDDIKAELEWYQYFRESKTPVICVISKIDENRNIEALAQKIKSHTDETPLLVSSVTKLGLDKLKEQMIRLIPENFGAESLTGKYINEDDVVLLVMPQDIQAPKGRLILPQVQTIRDLLDRKCIVISATTDKFEQALATLNKPPKLIITDSQVFRKIYDKKPKESMLTSFSVLFAAYKGDLDYYMKSAYAIERLTEDSKVLIAECCTHAPLAEDIGREKIPAMLRKKVGKGLTVNVVSGTDFPENITNYDLIIQCGACMFNKKYVLTRINKAKENHVPMSNYGVVIAYLAGILGDISV